MKMTKLDYKEVNIIRKYLHLMLDDYSENETWEYNLRSVLEKQDENKIYLLVGCIEDLFKYLDIENEDLKKLQLEIVSSDNFYVQPKHHITDEQRELNWSNVNGKPSSHKLISLEDYILSMKFILANGTKKQLKECTEMIQIYYDILCSMLKHFKKYVIFVDGYNVGDSKKLSFFPFVMPITTLDNEVSFDIYDLKKLKQIYEEIKTCS